MAHAPDRNGGVTTGIPARNFFDVDELLSNARLAFLYTDMLINSPTTITAAKERTGLKKSTAYKYRNELAEMGLARELDRHEDGAALWEVDAIGGDWIGDDHITVGPTVIIAVYGASTTDEDIDLFIDRHGRRAIAPAVEETIEYLRGNKTRRGVADALGVPAVEGIAISQAIERIIGALDGADPSLAAVPFEIEIHDLAVEDAPYRQSDG